MGDVKIDKRTEYRCLFVCLSSDVVSHPLPDAGASNSSRGWNFNAYDLRGLTMNSALRIEDLSCC